MILRVLCDSVVSRERDAIGDSWERGRAVVERRMSNKANLPQGAGPGMADEPNFARARPGCPKAETLHPNGIQWPEDERQNAKRGQFAESKDAPRRHGGHRDDYNYIQRQGLHETLSVLCDSVVSRGGAEGVASNKANFILGNFRGGGLAYAPYTWRQAGGRLQTTSSMARATT